MATLDPYESMNSRLIRLSKASLSNAELEAVQRPLTNEFLGMGQETRLFEEELSAFFGRPVVCVVNGTAALQLALQAIGIGPGGRGSCSFSDICGILPVHFSYRSDSDPM